MAVSWIDLDEFARRFGVEFMAGNLSLEFSGVVQSSNSKMGFVSFRVIEIETLRSQTEHLGYKDLIL
jgi:hypothetical protein